MMPENPRTSQSRTRPAEKSRNLRELSLFLNEGPEFRLGLATYDVPETREKYLKELVNSVAGQPVHISRLDLSQSPNEELLLDRLENHLRANPTPEGKQSAVMIVGLEAAIDFHLVPPNQTFRGGSILINANLQRGLFLRLCPIPIVVWLNSWGYTAFAQAAPDLWHWRSGTFSFQSSPDSTRNLQVEAISTPMVEIEGKPYGQKRERIGMLRDLVTALENEDERDTAGNQARRAALMLQIGLVYSQLSERHEALDYFNRAKTLYRAAGDLRGEAYSLLNLGSVYREIGQIEKTLPLYEEALAISRRIGDKRFEEILLCEIGNAYSNLNQFNQALALFDQARTIAQEIGDRHGEADTLTNMGNAYRDLGQLEQSINHKEEALAIAREVGNRGLEAHVLGGLGAIYTNGGQVERGLGALDQALAIARKLGDRHTEGYALANLGTTYSMLGSPVKAIEFLNQSHQIAEAIGDPRLIQFATKHRARLENSLMISK
jgi:tetratricopeptide (TPR) repeat protein